MIIVEVHLQVFIHIVFPTFFSTLFSIISFTELQKLKWQISEMVSQAKWFELRSFYLNS